MLFEQLRIQKWFQLSLWCELLSLFSMVMGIYLACNFILSEGLEKLLSFCNSKYRICLFLHDLATAHLISDGWIGSTPHMGFFGQSGILDHESLLIWKTRVKIYVAFWCELLPLWVKDLYRSQGLIHLSWDDHHLLMRPKGWFEKWTIGLTMLHQSLYLAIKGCKYLLM